ncbi:MAG TPA: hypothetical protein PKE29_15355 [Phycisphaerales bacterium]|nr:hypothetical protein [Phycisphaerales bacterium]
MARTRTALAIIAGLGLSVGMLAGPAAPAAEAQVRMGMGRGMGMGTPERITTADVEQYSKILRLTDTQREAVKDLHQAYEREFDAAEKVMREKLEKIQQDFQDTQDPSVWTKDMPEVQKTYSTRTEALEKSFIGDLKSLLTGEQSARWPAAERAQRRARSLGGGMAAIPGFGLAGESVDLIKMVDELRLAKTPETLSQVLDRYELEIDGALEARDSKRKEIAETMQKQQQDRMKDGGGMMPDFQKLQEQMGEMRKSGLPVRNINDRYSTLIAAALPEAQRDDFVNGYKRAKFPNIYKEPYAIKALNAARAFTDLTSEQKAGIGEITASYQRDVAGANERYERAQMEAEKDGGGDDMVSGWMRMMGGDQGKDESELTVAKKERRKLDSDALAKLKDILTPEQKDRLPERENDMFGFGGPRRR